MTPHSPRCATTCARADRRPRWRRRAAWPALALALAIAGGAAAPAVADDAKLLEHKVKAAIVFWIAEFADWPEGTFPSPTAPIVLGILGDDPLGDAIERTVKDKKAKGRPFKLKRARDVADLADCQIIYVSKSEDERLEKIIAKVDRDRTILISDMERFAERGGTLGIPLERGTVQLELNVTRAKASPIKFDSQIWKMATLVEEVPASGPGEGAPRKEGD